MGTARVYVASKSVAASLGLREHLYLVYDPDTDGDGNASTGSGVEIIRGGPAGAGIFDDEIVVEVGVGASNSEDDFDGDTPADRNFTSLASGGSATTLWTTMKGVAEDLGSYDAGTKKTTMDQEYYGLGPNSNAIARAVMEGAGLDFEASLPQVGGSGPTMSPRKFTGQNVVLRYGQDGTIDTTDIPQGNGPIIVIDNGGTDEYVVPADRTTWIIEDGDPLTNDEVTIDGMDMADASYMRNGNDLIICNANGMPIVVIKDHFSGKPVATVNFDDGSVPVLPSGLTPFAPPPFKPLNIPGWIPAGVYGPFNDGQGLQSPLIVDLDNDGIEVSALNSATTTTFFDIDGDGYREQTAWVGGDDGLLVRDLNSNGQIDDASELFGSATADGFALLSALDTNGDHVINGSDADFSDLMIWKDTNGDAYAQSGEIQTLSYWNIQSISLAGVTASTDIINGNPVSHTSTVTLNSGATRAIADVWFVHDNVNSYYDADYTLDIRTLFLPNLRGFGEMPDLHIAMSLDADLLSMVQGLTADWTMVSFSNGDSQSDVEAILLKWAGVQGVDPYARKDPLLDSYIDIDSRHLAFLEKFLGESYFNIVNPGGDPGPRAYAELQKAWQFALEQMHAQLVSQMGAHVLFGDTLSYNVWAGDFDGSRDLSQTAIDDLVAFATASGVNAETYWRNVANFIAYTEGTDNVSATEEGWLDAAIYASDPSLTWDIVKVAATYTGINYSGTNSDETITGSTNDDYIQGNGGNDTIYGGNRHDQLYAGSGDDTVWAGTGNDQIWGDIGTDTIYGENGHDIIYGGSDNDLVDGGDGNDSVYGEGGNDTISGGLGGNNLYGGTGDDLYMYAGGVDVISEEGGTDTIYLSSGITLGEVTFSRIYDQYEGSLLITITGAGSIEIEYQFYSYSGFHVETLDFYDPLDGTINLTTLTNLTTHGSEGDDHIVGVTNPAHLNDTIYGYEGADYLEGKDGDDTLDGGVGNDLLYGDGGDDTFIASYGFDEYWDTAGSNDVIVIPAAYSASDVSFIRSAGAGLQNLIIMIEGLGQIKVGYQFQGYPIEKITFANGIDADITLSNVAFDVVGTEGDNSNLEGLTSMGAPDEHIYGYGGNDMLTGNNGNDVLDGGFGDDTLYGDSGDDTFVMSAGNDVIRETTGNDVLLIPEAYDVNDVSFYRLASEYMYYVHVAVAGLGDVQIIDQLPSNLVEKVSFANGIDGDILFSNVAFVVLGTATADYMFGITSGSNPNETFYGYAGNDTVIGDTGNDFIDGGDGDDSMDGGAGTDTVSYLTASASVNVSLAVTSAQVTGGSGTDTITTVENLNGSLYGDLLIGDSGANVINGDAGDDVIEGGTGNDTLTGGSGTDTLSYSGSGTGVTVNLATTTGQNTVGAGTDTVSGFENLRGSAANDTLTGDGNANVIEGGAGNDTINGAGGTDTLTYANAAAAVTVNLATATAQNTAGAGTDTISNFENLTGSAYNDTLTGNTLANIIEGGAGNDTISGGDGDDTLNGGAGNDTLTGGNGIDTITYIGAVSAVTVNLTTTTAQNTGGAGTDTITTVENVIGSIYNDTLTGTTAANVISGGDGNDTISAGDGNDTLNGGSGNDTLTGGNGTDTVTYVDAVSAVTVNLATATAQNTGGAGSDTLATIENLTGSAYNDTLTGNSSANTIAGGDGNDTVEGAAGNDVLTGGNGTDTVSFANAASAITFNLSTTTSQNTVGAGSDTVSGFENVTGSGFNDTLTGDGNANVIRGGAGNDTISGGAGNDILYGEAGLDGMTGGLNADTFVFQAASAYSNIDTISDFSTAQGDALNLANLLGEYDPLTEAITDFVLAATSGSNTNVSVDRDGTGSTYGWTQIATLTGVTGLTDEAALVTNGNLIVS